MKNINVTVQPRAKRNQVEQIGDFSFKVYTTAPARNNQANQAVLKLLAKYLQISRSKLILTAGRKAKEKIFSIIE